MATFRFSIGYSKVDNTPRNFEVTSFAEARDVWSQDRSKTKGHRWVAAPFAAAPDNEAHRAAAKCVVGLAHRCASCVLPRAFVGLDIDRGLTSETFKQLLGWAGTYSTFAYETASSTPDKPRCRLIIEIDKAVDREMMLKLSRVIQAQIHNDVSSAIQFDQSCDRSEQPLYLPLVGAKTYSTDGLVMRAGDLLRDYVPPVSAMAVPKTNGMAATVAENRHQDVCALAAALSRKGTRRDSALMLFKAEVEAGRYVGRVPTEKEFLDAYDGADRKYENGRWQRPAADSRATAPKPTVDLVSAATLTPRSIRWLWNGWLAQGKLCILAGAPGTGKTTIGLALAATISRGGHFPDGTRSSTGNVLIWSGEDDWSDTILPRLQAAGADTTRIYFIGQVGLAPASRRPFDPARDMPDLQRQTETIGGVSLLICDPIVAAVSGDAHKNAEVRRGRQPLVDFANRYDCAVLGVTHFSKGTVGKDVLERVTGSIAFAAVARVVWVAAKVQEFEGADSRILARAKSNIGADDGGFYYRLDQDIYDGIEASIVRWGAAVEGSARDLLGESDTESADKVVDSKAWLRMQLADCAVTTEELRKRAKADGIAWRSVDKAKSALGVRAARASLGNSGKGHWEWRLPLRAVTGTVAADADVAPVAVTVRVRAPATLATTAPMGEEGKVAAVSRTPERERFKL